MAVYREQEFCPDCRQPYEGIYAHNDGTFVGDDFIGWDKDSHVCTPKENSAHSFTEPSEQKPEVVFAGTNDINFDVHSGKGRQKITDHFEDVSKGAEEVLKKHCSPPAFNSNHISVLSAISAMQEFAQQSREQARSEAIQQCIDSVWELIQQCERANDNYRGLMIAHEALETLKHNP